MTLQILTILILSMCLNVISEFPEDPKPCKYGDTECVKTIINNLFKDKSKGDDSLNLRQINPLKFDHVRLQQGEESPVNLDLNLKNCDLYGLNTAKALKVKGFGKDLTKKHSILLHVDYISVVGDYDINGKILILPIKGSGNMNITMVDADLVLSFVGKPLVKDGATYMNINQIKVEIADPKNFKFKVDNLFNGDKALGDNMNLFLNDNWKDIFQEVRESLNKAYGEVFTDVVNSVFSKYPYDKYFTE